MWINERSVINPCSVHYSQAISEITLICLTIILHYLFILLLNILVPQFLCVQTGDANNVLQGFNELMILINLLEQSLVHGKLPVNISYHPHHYYYYYHFKLPSLNCIDVQSYSPHPFSWSFVFIFKASLVLLNIILLNFH